MFALPSSGCIVANHAKVKDAWRYVAVLFLYIQAVAWYKDDKHLYLWQSRCRVVIVRSDNELPSAGLWGKQQTVLFSSRLLWIRNSSLSCEYKVFPKCLNGFLWQPWHSLKRKAQLCVFKAADLDSSNLSAEVDARWVSGPTSLDAGVWV